MSDILVYLPGPVGVEVTAIAGVTVTFALRDAAHAAAFADLLETAQRQGYAVEIKLLHYDGQRDAPEGRKRRAEAKAQGGKVKVRAKEREAFLELTQD